MKENKQQIEELGYLDRIAQEIEMDYPCKTSFSFTYAMRDRIVRVMKQKNLKQSQVLRLLIELGLRVAEENM